ncbi:MAG: BMP family protein [Bacillota bacterium]
MKHPFKKTLVCLVCILMLTSLIGCATEQPADNGEPEKSAPPQATQAPTEAPKKVFKVAALLPGSINDGSWSTLGYNAAKNAAEKYGAEFSYIEISSAADVLEAAEDYAQRGFDLVFGHSTDYQDSFVKICDQYPGTYFVVTNGTINKDNMTGVINKAYEGNYLSGVIAALSSKTKKIAYIGPTEMQSINESMAGFKQGAVSVVPDIEVILTYLGTGTDVGKAKESAQALINNGVDVIQINCNQAGQGVIALGLENIGKVVIIPSNAVLSDEYPDLILADMPNENYAAGVDKVLKDIIEGNFTPGGYEMGVGDSETCIPSKLMDIPQEHLDKFAAAKQGIIDGTIAVSRVLEK